MQAGTRTFLAVGLGGALGTGARVGLSLAALAQIPEHAFLATLLANILGAALIGYLSTRALSVRAKGFWMTGFCGGFTTFSLFSLELLTLVEKSPTVALAYGSGSLALWVLAVWGGVRFGCWKSARSGSPPPRP
ncbi:MAG: CrcB family protein [Rhodobacteraceae bacterium]|nr:MAG: CrcB family protein [Paracoccaceae bacterium]